MSAVAEAAGPVDVDRLDAARCRVWREPFAFLIAERQLDPDDADRLRADFPRYAEAGFFPYEPSDCGPSVRHLVEQLTGPEFARAIGERLNLPELPDKPVLVTLCRALNRRHGTIHTDSRSKLATALLYLNADWPDTSDGCLRFLAREDDIEALVVPEVRPVYGNLVAFRRSDNSFHGHLPHEGERMVIQIAWLTSREALARKTRRGRFSRWLKSLLGRIDRDYQRNRSRVK